MGNMSTLSESFNAKNLCSRVSSTECRFYLYKTMYSIGFLSHPFGGLRGNVCDSSVARWKVASQLSKHFSPALMAEALIRRSRLLLKGWINLGINIMFNGYVYRQDIYTVR